MQCTPVCLEESYWKSPLEQGLGLMFACNCLMARIIRNWVGGTILRAHHQHGESWDLDAAPFGKQAWVGLDLSLASWRRCKSISYVLLASVPHIVGIGLGGVSHFERPQMGVEILKRLMAVQLEFYQVSRGVIYVNVSQTSCWGTLNKSIFFFNPVPRTPDSSNQKL